MVPRPVTTLEALLGHISEHLLQLLGGGRAPEGEETRPGVEEVWGVSLGVLRNNSCLASRKVAVCVCGLAERAGPYVPLRVGATGTGAGGGSMVRCRLMTDSNRLKIAQPNVPPSHVIV